MKSWSTNAEMMPLQNLMQQASVKLAEVVDSATKETAKTPLENKLLKLQSECLENGIKEKLKGKTPEGLRSNTAINDMQDKQNEMRKYMGIKK